MNKRTGVVGLLHDLDFKLAMLTLLGLIIITVMGVVMRYFVNKPLTWLEEVQLWFIVWVIFFGASGVARKNGHIAIDAFVGLFPLRLRMATELISNITAVLVLGFLGIYAFRHVQLMYTTMRTTNILGVPYYFIYMVIPLSCLMMVIHSARMAIRILNGKKREAADV